jgi:hypothetical protein
MTVPAVHPVSYQIDATRVCFPRAKAAGGETVHSFPSSIGAKNTWRSTFLSPYFFTAWCLIKHKNKFIRKHSVRLTNIVENSLP